MTDSEHRDEVPKSTGPVRTRGRLLPVAVVLVVATVWVASLLWVRSYSVTSQAGAAATTTAAPSPTGSGTTSSPAFIYITVTATPEPAPTVTATVTRAIQVAPMGVLSSTGLGALQLGMSYKAAVATGQLTQDTGGAWFVKDHPRAWVCMSKAGGVMAIFADKSAITPEGVHVGSSLTQVQAAYPNLYVNEIAGWGVQLNATTSYDFSFSANQPPARLTGRDLRSIDQTCFN